MKSKLAKGLFENGYNCSQAVACAFADEMGIDEKTVEAISCPLGGGVARCRSVCGAVTGMMLVLGSRFKDKTKAEVYELSRKYIDKFVEENGSMICAELLEGVACDNSTSVVPEQRTKRYYEVRPCSELVAFAAKLLEEGVE